MRPLVVRFVVVMLVFIPMTASAQLLPGVGVFSVETAPANPTPYGRVAVTPVIGSLDLNSATMQVLVDGKPFYQGNSKSVSVPLGSSGTLTTIEVIMTSRGKSYSKTVSVRPQEVTLVVEPLSTAPAFYLGKPLVPIEGSARIVAIANLRTASGAVINPSTLSYSWVVDGTRIFSSSGIGKNTIIVASALQYRSREVSVSVANPDGSLTSGSSVTLSAQEPVVRIYESDPLLGVLSAHAISGSYSVAGKERTLFAVPYSFPTNTTRPSLSWALNGSLAQKGSLITLRPTGSGEGSATLLLTASGGQTVLKSSSLNLSFGAAPSGLGILGI
jgi:hypothetical protein